MSARRHEGIGFASPLHAAMEASREEVVAELALAGVSMEAVEGIRREIVGQLVEALADAAARGRAPAPPPAIPGAEKRPMRAATFEDFFGRQNWAAILVARVESDGASSAAILDGDAALVDTSRKAADGDIVLVRVEGRRRILARLRLLREGVALDAIDGGGEIHRCDGTGIAIVGVVVARAGRID